MKTKKLSGLTTLKVTSAVKAVGSPLNHDRAVIG
jgi:hypothetical protein